MKIKGPSGRIYEWKKETPPTEADMAELQKYDSLSYELQATRDVMADPKSNPAQKLGAIAPYAFYKGADMLASMGIRGGGAALGQVAGQRFAGKPGAIIGGGVGGAVGSLADQARLIAGGQQEGISGGQLVGDIIAGANPSRGMAANALTNAAAAQAESLMDTGQLAGADQTLMAGSMGALGAGVSKLRTGMEKTDFDQVHRKRLEIARELRKEGVIINPAEIKRGSATVQSIAGKADLGFDFSQRNQPVWQRFAREDLGLNAKEIGAFEMKKIVAGKIIDGEIETAIKKGYEPYETIKQISEKAKKDGEKYFTAMGGHERAIQEATAQGRKLITEAAADIDQLKLAQHLKHEAYKRLKSNEPGAWDAYQAAKAKVSSLEDSIDQAAQSAGDPKLLERLRNGRKKIAIGYAYLNATDSYTGLVNPKLLTQQFDEDPVRLTGRARQIAEFEKSFGRNAVEASQVPAPGVSQMGTNFAMMGAAQGNPYGTAAATAPYWRKPFREYIASDTAQNRYLQPQTQFRQEDFIAAIARLAPQAAGRREQPPNAAFLRYMQNPAPFSPTF